MWTNTKVDWKATDYFNIEDWKRIRSNLEHLYEQLKQMKSSGPPLLETDTGREYDELPYVHLVNNMELNLVMLQEVLRVKFPEELGQKTWFERMHIWYSGNPTYKDWNRWEEGLQLVHECIQYIDTYVFSSISGTCSCGSARTVLKFSRGR